MSVLSPKNSGKTQRFWRFYHFGCCQLESECDWLISESGIISISLILTSMNMKKVGWRMLLFLLVLSEAISVQATTIAYNPGDLLVCFRKTPTGTYDLEVDAGRISTFTNLAIGQKITITNYTGTQLGQVGTNNVAWSSFGYLNVSTAGTPTNVLFMTNPRYDLNTQTDPLYRPKQSGLNGTISLVEGISEGMTNFVGDSVSSSSTAALVLESHTTQPYVCYAAGLGANSDFQGTFQTDPEQSTGASFTTGGQPVRADFYRLDPSADTSHPPAIYLGYFEFATNGVMTYTAGPSPTVIVAAAITSIVRSGTTNTITFTTGSGGTYTLRGTNNLTASVTNWPAINSIAGDGSPHSLKDVTTNSPKFYIISAQ